MKQIMITGANGQLGSFLAKNYYQEGYRLVLLYHRRTDRIDGLLAKSEVLAERIDLSDYAGLNGLMANRKVYPDVLIHCASLRSSDAKALTETDPAMFKSVIETNLLSAYHVLRAVLPEMQEKGFGRVILMGSNVTRSGLAQGSAYAAAKAAIVNLGKSVARELAKANVLINSVSPAPVETDLEADYQGEYLEFRKAYFAEYLNNVPSGKLVTKLELKKVIDLLISDEIANLTGQEIFIEGGMP